MSAVIGMPWMECSQDSQEGHAYQHVANNSFYCCIGNSEAPPVYASDKDVIRQSLPAEAGQEHKQSWRQSHL